MRRASWVFILYILLVMLLAVLACMPSRRPVESFSEPITLHDWWGGDHSIDIAIFNELFANIPTDKRIEICSVIGGPPADANYDRNSILRVQFSGEPHFHPPHLFDLNFIPAERSLAPSIVHFPYAYYQILSSRKDIQRLTQPRTITEESISQKKFCLFAVSNGGCQQRNDFFNRLSTYKQVDSCGKFMNNLGHHCPGTHEDDAYDQFISQYKFMICFENVSKPHYFTEKLVNAYYAGTIPIYWGCPNVGDYVNLDAILYLPPEFTDQDVRDLMDKIAVLDTNDAAYQEYYCRTFFKGGQIPDDFNLAAIQKKVAGVLSN